MPAFTEDNGAVVATFSVAGFSISMRYECSSKLYAKLLREQLQAEAYKATEEFARENYNNGFDDHKKRKPRREWHPSSMRKS